MIPLLHAYILLSLMGMVLFGSVNHKISLDGCIPPTQATLVYSMSIQKNYLNDHGITDWSTLNWILPRAVMVDRLVPSRQGIPNLLSLS